MNTRGATTAKVILAVIITAAFTSVAAFLVFDYFYGLQAEEVVVEETNTEDVVVVEEEPVVEEMSFLEMYAEYEDYLVAIEDEPEELEQFAEVTVSDCDENSDGVCDFVLALMAEDDNAEMFYLMESGGAPGFLYGPFYGDIDTIIEEMGMIETLRK